MNLIETSFEELTTGSPEPAFTTDIVEIESVQKNPESDFLYIYKLKGFELYLQSSRVYSVGDKAVCIHVDSVLPVELEAKLFPEGSKIKLENRRIRAIKIRKFISQGLLLPLEDLETIVPDIHMLSVGSDIRERLGIIKYEPPVKETPNVLRTGNPETKNPLFKEFTDLDHLKWNPDVIEEGTEIVLTEKLHGTSARFGKLPFTRNVMRNTFWHKVKRFFGFKPEFDLVTEVQSCIGSRKVQIHMKPKGWKGFYETNVWSIVEDKLNLTSKLPVGFELFGEIVGPSIQKGFHYGMKDGEYDFYAYDLMINQKYVDYDTFVKFCDDSGIKRVPEVYRGSYNIDKINKHVSGASVATPIQKIREGVVIRPVKEKMHPRTGRVILKHINPEYLLLKTTDWE